MSDSTYPVFRAVPTPPVGPMIRTRQSSRKDHAAIARWKAQAAEMAQRPRYIWPLCETQQAGQGTHDNYDAYGAVPLCVAHVYEVWQLAQDATSRTDSEWRLGCVKGALAREMPSTIPGGHYSRTSPIHTHPGDIYYLEIDSHIKIGYTSALGRRIKEYPPTAKLLAYHPGTRTDETTLHRVFLEHRAARREWYVDHPDIRLHIERVLNRYGPPPEVTYSQEPERRPQHVTKRARSGGTFGR